jgi:uncharacterized protein
MLPPKLKDMNLFNEGATWRGLVVAVTLPNLTRKLEGYRGAGMDSEYPVDMGGDVLEMETEFGGPMLEPLRTFGEVGTAGIYRRFAGSYQSDDTGEVATIEVIARGRDEEINFGEQKMGESGSFKVKTKLTYYRVIWNGVDVVEIDVANGIYITGGVDRRAAIRVS